MIFNFHFSPTIEKLENRKMKICFLEIKKLKSLFDYHFFLNIEEMKNENLLSLFFFFFWTQNENENNPKIKKNNQSRYNRFPGNCCHLLL